jgi:hypothetical protein
MFLGMGKSPSELSGRRVRPRPIDSASKKIVLAALLAVGCGRARPTDPRLPAVEVDPGGALAAETDEPVPAPKPAPSQPGPGPVGAFVPPAASGLDPALPLGEAASPADEEELRPLLDRRVTADGRGSSFVGGPFGGRFDTGEVLELELQMNPNQCYTVVATAVGITELDLQLVPDLQIPGFPPVLLAQDAESGPDATVGGGKQCFKMPMPMIVPVRARLVAVKGAGIAAAQILVR